MTGSKLSAAVLAGGLGRRLGGIEKGQLRLPDGRTLAQALVSLVGAFADEVMVSTNRPLVYAALEPRPRFVADVHGERGAPGAVVSVLQAARNPWVLVLACDMPFVDAEVLERLLSAERDGVDAVCGAREGRVEPLLALYRAEVAQRWALKLPDNPSLRALVEAGPHQLLELGAHAAFKNLNTLADCEAAGVELPSTPQPG